MDIKLLGAPLSPFVRKVRIMLALKNIPHEFDPRITPFDLPPDYEKINPLRKIPAMVVSEGGKDYAMPDSSVMCAFLERAFPKPALYPTTPIEYGRALWFEEYADTEIATKGTFAFFGQVFFPLVKGEEVDYTKIEENFVILKDVFDYLEGELAGRDWLVGDEMSIADISVVTQFISVHNAGYDVTEQDSPALYGLIKRVMSHEIMSDILAIETKAMETLNYHKPDLNAYRLEKNI